MQTTPAIIKQARNSTHPSTEMRSGFLAIISRFSRVYMLENSANVFKRQLDQRKFDMLTEFEQDKSEQGEN